MHESSAHDDKRETTCHICVAPDVPADDAISLRRYISELNSSTSLGSAPLRPFIEVSEVSELPSLQDRRAYLFCLASKGLSRFAWSVRQARYPPLVSSQLLSRERVMHNQAPDEAWRWFQRIPEAFALLPLSGYILCITGFIISTTSAVCEDRCSTNSKAAITQCLERLGAHMQPRLDNTVDILLVPWADLGDAASDRWTAKVQFALKCGIPVLCAHQFAEMVASGAQPMDVIVQRLCLPSRDVASVNNSSALEATSLHRIEESVLLGTTATGGGSALPPDHEMDVVKNTKQGNAMTGEPNSELSDDDVMALCTPMWVVLFGMTAAETQTARRYLSHLHRLGVSQQPVLTSLTTHIVVGMAVEAVAPIKGNRDALEHFVTHLHRMPLSRMKTMTWLASLSGMQGENDEPCDADDDSAELHRLRLHYDAHCLFTDSTDERAAPHLLLNGFLAPMAELDPVAALPQENKAKHVGLNAISTAITVLQPQEESGPSDLIERPRLNSKQSMQPWLLVKELSDIMRGIWPQLVDELIPATNNVSEGTHHNDVMASLMALLTAKSVTTIFHEMTFLCLEEDATTRSEKKPVEHRDEKWLFALHRKAAVRLLIKGCGGTLVRKTESELSSMLEDGNEWFRSTHRRGSSSHAKRRRGLEFVALIPHANERCTESSPIALSRKGGNGAKQPTPPANSSSLRGQQRNAAAQKSAMEQLCIPVATTTWLQAAVCRGGCAGIEGFSLKVKRLGLRGGCDKDAEESSLVVAQREFHSLGFLRHFPLVMHPLAALITTASLPNLDRVLPVTPSPFLTTLRYVKHRVSASSDEAAAEVRDVSHGVVVMFVCRHQPNYLTDADILALQRVCGALGGKMEPMQRTDDDSGVLESLPLQRVTHIVTNDTARAPATAADEVADVDQHDNEKGATHHPHHYPFVLLDGSQCIDDSFVRQREVLRCAVLAAQFREDVVVVDQSWIRQSVAVGYFVDEAEFRVGPCSVLLGAHRLPTQRTTNESRSRPSASPSASKDDHDIEANKDDVKFDALGDVMTHALSRLEKTIGEANSSVMGSDASRTLTRKRSRSDDAGSAVKVEPVVSTVTAPQPAPGPPARTPVARVATAQPTADVAANDDDRRREESPTAAHCVTPSFGVHQVSTAPQRTAARIYVLSSVPKLQELQDAVTTRLSQPAVSLPASRTSDCEPGQCAMSAPVWSHLVWTSTSSGADIIVTNEVAQRESVLFAMAAGVWLVTDAFIWDSYREHRLCNIAPYEWGPHMLKEPKKTTLALASNISHWRRLRQVRQRGPFGLPCIQQVIVIGSSIASTLASIIRVGGGNVEFLKTDDSAGSPSNEELMSALNHSDVLPPDAMCHRQQRVTIILVRKDATAEYLGPVISCMRLWLTGLRKEHQLRPTEEREELCTYPGHTSDGGDCPSTAAGSRQCVEVHSHDWVSAVLQRRTSSMQTRIIGEEV
jgi:hypothetical protein